MLVNFSRFISTSVTLQGFLPRETYCATSNICPDGQVIAVSLYNKISCCGWQNLSNFQTIILASSYNLVKCEFFKFHLVPYMEICWWEFLLLILHKAQVYKCIYILKQQNKNSYCSQPPIHLNLLLLAAWQLIVGSHYLV